MKEYEQRQRERSKLEVEARRNLPERQLQMFLSGPRGTWSCCNRVKLAEFFNHSKTCEHQRGIDIEPGLRLLREEYNACKIIRLDDKTHKRLVDFAKPDELILDTVNRLLDIAQEAKAAQIGEKTAVS